MQEEIVSKSVDIGIRVTNLTLDLILKALDAITRELEKKPEAKTPGVAKEAQQPELKHGKQTLKELHKHNEGLSSVELSNPHLRKLHREMKKADIDFSVMKDGKGKYTLLFKGKDADEMTRAFKQYTKKVVKIEDKKAIRQELREAKAAAKALNNDRSKEKNRSKGARDR